MGSETDDDHALNDNAVEGKGTKDGDTEKERIAQLENQIEGAMAKFAKFQIPLSSFRTNVGYIRHPTLPSPPHFNLIGVLGIKNIYGATIKEFRIGKETQGDPRVEEYDISEGTRVEAYEALLNLLNVEFAIVLGGVWSCHNTEPDLEIGIAQTTLISIVRVCRLVILIVRLLNMALHIVAALLEHYVEPVLCGIPYGRCFKAVCYESLLDSPLAQGDSSARIPSPEPPTEATANDMPEPAREEFTSAPEELTPGDPTRAPKDPTGVNAFHENINANSKAPLRKKRPTRGDLRRVVAVWDFDKPYHQQEASTVELGLRLLLPREKNKPWVCDGDRSCAVYDALQNGIQKVLCQCGCRSFSYNGKTLVARPDKEGVAAPNIPEWLKIPYIVVEDGRDFCGAIMKSIIEERAVLRQQRGASAKTLSSASR
ncbi:hypothetical protein P280DRAFT_522562 [Massarina eburnea CBS 473.64]|uniref:Uncharacterized protein n=1 Tax=Massarina eburnea CBS 473.64 TaxID=1395130 RepID=A0A6A6RNE9_9PLEO|nr:hypothetical protein P280DRAFT_522562 [Massarina eburnea CBS 473.64]